MGLGPKAFVHLGGTTLLERAVAAMAAAAARVIVAVPSKDVARAQRLVDAASVTVIAGKSGRTGTLRELVRCATGHWLILHDVVHPFVTAELTCRVLREARRTGAAAAVLPNVDYWYGRDGVLRGAPRELVAIQKPIAFTRATIQRGFEIAQKVGLTRDASVLEILYLAEQAVTFVAGHSRNFKLTTADDIALAECLASRG